MSENALTALVVGAVVTVLCSLIGLSAYDSHLQRQCRENLAKLETSRSAADITQICK